MVGIDGGYVRDWNERTTNFELIVRRSMPEDREPRYIGMVHGYDAKLKRRLIDLLKTQGLQANQDVTFLTDGGEEVRSLTEAVTPHRSMCWTGSTLPWLSVLEQYARGAAHHGEEGQCLLKSLTRIKWLLWHGNQHRAQQETKNIVYEADSLELNYSI